MVDALMDAMSEWRSDITCAISDNAIEKHAGIKACAMGNFCRQYPRDREGAKTLRRYLDFLCSAQYNVELNGNPFSYSQKRPIYHLFHNPNGAPSIETIKKKFGNKKYYFEISAAKLFTSFNKPSEKHVVGAFTHCLYMLAEQQKQYTGLGGSSPIDSNCYIIVTGIDTYDPDDGYDDVLKLISRDNLKSYYDEVMKELEHDTSQLNIVFTCKQLPEMLLWRLADISNVENWKFEPEILNCNQFQGALSRIANEKWKVVTVNCGVLVVKKVQYIMNRQNCDILTLRVVKQLQNELNQWFPKWRICWMTEPPIWQYSVPCLLYEKKGNNQKWYLVFYAPLQWSDDLPDRVAFNCDDDDRVENFYDNIGTNGINNVNNYEQDLNNMLDYPISLLVHQCVAGLNDVLAQHREAYRSINVELKQLCKRLSIKAMLLEEPFRSVYFAMAQVIEGNGKVKTEYCPSLTVLEPTLPTVSEAIKQLLKNIDDNKYVNKKYAVIYCSRNTVACLGDRQKSILVYGPINVVVVMLN
uniref:Piwi domain-containing protein n=1 Tax=Panagrellus redivivus TaxID=6233 RepID=A0A7E4W9P9_PANRE